uniref:GLOBIN domain-containing protein n=1 Tax=Caenorhabditis tropicalis TaxID=1561998 RepID=A0A1I7TYI7_9PELO
MAVFKKLRKNKDKSLPLPEPEAVKPLDKRVGIDSYRDFFTLKNWWKSVDRKRVEAGAYMFSKYLRDFPENRALYTKLKNVNPQTVDMNCSDPGFEAMSGQYLKVFDDVITAVEEKPGDVQTACDRLQAVGKMHRQKVTGMESIMFQNMEEPFIQMVKYILQDRFNEKAEMLYRKFFQFCLKYLLEGFNG